MRFVPFYNGRSVSGGERRVHAHPDRPIILAFDPHMSSWGEIAHFTQVEDDYFVEEQPEESLELLLAHLLERLPELEREVLVRVAVCGLSLRATGRELGFDDKRAKRLYEKAVDSLRAALLSPQIRPLIAHRLPEQETVSGLLQRLAEQRAPEDAE